MRAWCLALLLAACGDATIGGPLADDDGRPDAAEDQDRPDARVIIDAPPPDARICDGGDARVEDPASGHCLIYVDLPSTWPAARDACLALDATLAAAGTQAENALLTSLPTNIGDQPDVWLGATDTTTEGTFVWITGDAMTYTNWRAGEPNNGGDSGTQEDCAVIEADTATGTWDDRPCTRSYPFLCERI